MAKTLCLKKMIPHGAPMLLLSAVVSVDEESACCEASVFSEMLFIDEQGDLPAWVGIELMAQTIAVWGGRYLQNEDRELSIGFLLGSRKYESQVEAFPAGSKLVITAEKVIVDGNMGVFQCTIRLDDQVVSSAQVNTYLPGKEELPQILERDF